MKNKTGIYTLRTAVILLLMITLALTSFCIPAFAAEDSPPESADGDASASAPVVFADDSLLGELEGKVPEVYRVGSANGAASGLMVDAMREGRELGCRI
jgi:hypothetical protein